MTTLLDRRSVLAGIGFALGGCVATRGLLSDRLPRIHICLRPDPRPWARDPCSRPVKDQPRSPSPADDFPRAVPAGRNRRERRRAKALPGSARRRRLDAAREGPIARSAESGMAELVAARPLRRVPVGAPVVADEAGSSAPRKRPPGTLAGLRQTRARGPRQRFGRRQFLPRSTPPSPCSKIAPAPIRAELGLRRGSASGCALASTSREAAPRASPAHTLKIEFGRRRPSRAF